MAYRYELTLDAAEEIDKAIYYYDSQFSTGGADFLSAFDDTIERLLKMPTIGRPMSSKDLGIRGLPLKAEKRPNRYAKKFPYMLIYKVYEAQEKVVVFQLWPFRSNRPLREIS